MNWNMVFHDKDRDHYFELELEGTNYDHDTIILKKGKRIYKNDIFKEPRK